jgi:hypothetical protein
MVNPQQHSFKTHLGLVQFKIDDKGKKFQLILIPQALWLLILSSFNISLENQV